MLGRTVVAVIVVAGLLWTVSRIRGPSPLQQAAMATLSALPPLQGPNAFRTLWQLPWAIPAGQREAVFAEAVRRWRAAATDPVAMPVPASVAAGRYPPTLIEADRERLCTSGRTCLAQVQADPAAFADVVARHADWFDRMASLSAHAGLRDPFGHPAGMPLPEHLPYGGQLRTRYALDFVQGRREAAFDGTCRAIATWRRLGANSDTLIARLASAAHVRASYADLFLSMLAQVPRDFVLPPSCDAAFAPTTANEFSLCDAARGEFAYVRSGLSTTLRQRASAGALDRVGDWLTIDEDMAIAEQAMRFAPFCAPETAAKIRADVRFVVSEPAERAFLRLECASDIAGCVLHEVGKSAGNDYAAQVEDANARIRLVAELLRLRAEASDASPVLERLEARHAAIGAASRKWRLVEDGRALCLDNYRVRPDEACWRVPLPPYFQAASR
ncbi:MAG: hypothetical protein ACTHOH_10015 [Lysobacteraceae bacterium]